jgi:hypothetical protein
MMDTEKTDAIDEAFWKWTNTVPHLRAVIGSLSLAWRAATLAERERAVGIVSQATEEAKECCGSCRKITRRALAALKGESDGR